MEARLAEVVKKSGEWTEEMYMGMVTKQIQEDKKKLEEITDNTTKQNFAERIRWMEAWVKEMTEEEDEE